MSQAILVSIMLGLGFFYVFPFLRRGSLPVVLGVAPFLGVLGWMFNVILFGLLTLPPHFNYVVGLISLTTGIYLVVTWLVIRWKIDLRLMGILAVCILAIFVSVYILDTIDKNTTNDLLFYTGDSFIMVDMGRFWLDPSLADKPDTLRDLREKSGDRLRHGLGMYGFLLPSIHGAIMFSDGFIDAYLPVLAYAFLFSILMMQSQLLAKLTSLNNRSIAAILGGQVLFMVLTFMFYTQLRYLGSNVMTMMYLTLSVLLFVSYKITDRAEWLNLSGLLLIGVSFSRTETPLVMLLVLFVYLITSRIPEKLALRAFAPPLAITAAWNLYIAWNLTTYGLTRINLLSPWMAIVFAAACLITIPGMILLSRLTDEQRQKINRLLVAGFMALVLFALLRGTGFKSSFAIISTMFFHYGLWGASWAGLLLLLILLTPEPEVSEETKVIRLIGIGGVIFVFALGGMVNHRIGWAGSGNRMLVQYFPLVVIYVTILFSKQLERRKARLQE